MIPLFPIAAPPAGSGQSESSGVVTDTDDGAEFKQRLDLAIAKDAAKGSVEKSTDENSSPGHPDREAVPLAGPPTVATSRGDGMHSLSLETISTQNPSSSPSAPLGEDITTESVSVESGGDLMHVVSSDDGSDQTIILTPTTVTEIPDEQGVGKVASGLVELQAVHRFGESIIADDPVVGTKKNRVITTAGSDPRATASGVSGRAIGRQTEPGAPMPQSNAVEPSGLVPNRGATPFYPSEQAGGSQTGLAAPVPQSTVDTSNRVSNPGALPFTASVNAVGSQTELQAPSPSSTSKAMVDPSVRVPVLDVPSTDLSGPATASRTGRLVPTPTSSPNSATGPIPLGNNPGGGAIAPSVAGPQLQTLPGAIGAESGGTVENNPILRTETAGQHGPGVIRGEQLLQTSETIQVLKKTLSGPLAVPPSTTADVAANAGASMAREGGELRTAPSATGNPAAAQKTVFDTGPAPTMAASSGRSDAGGERALEDEAGHGTDRGAKSAESSERVSSAPRVQVSNIAPESRPESNIRTRQVVEVRGPRLAQTITQETASGTNRITLRVADENGEVTNIRLVVRGDTVQATIINRNDVKVGQLASRIDDLYKALERRGFSEPYVVIKTGVGKAEVSAESNPSSRNWERETQREKEYEERSQKRERDSRSKKENER